MGELLIRGPWIISEYYNDPQPAKFHDGWLITGDVAKMDADQYVIICDRSKDLIKSGGEWISSVDLENHIVGMPGVEAGRRRRASSSEVGRAPGRARRAADGEPASPKEAVLAHCATAFAKWQLPDDVLLVEALPLTSTGKLDKKVIRADLQSRGLQASGSEGLSGTMGKPRVAAGGGVAAILYTLKKGREAGGILRSTAGCARATRARPARSAWAARRAAW